jgi:Flp pilus assembly protein TadD
MQVHSTWIPVSVFFGLFSVVGATDYWLSQDQLRYKQVVVSPIEVPENSSVDVRTPIDQQSVSLELYSDILQKENDGVPLVDQSAFTQLPDITQAAILDKRILELMQNKEYNEVIRLCRSTHLQRRLSTGLQFDYALALSRSGQHKQAMRAYRLLLEHQPNHQAAAINLGLQLLASKQYAEADEILTGAVSISSGVRKAKALSALASARKRQGDWIGAEKAYARSIEYRPGHANTWMKLAQARQQLDMPYVHTEKTYQRAAALAVDSAAAWSQLGRYRLLKLDFTGAIDALNRASALSGRNERLRKDLAWANLEHGRVKAAHGHWSWLKKYAKSDNDRLLAEHMLGLINQQQRSLAPLPQHRAEFRYARALLTGKPGGHNDSDRENADRESSIQQLQTLLASPEWGARAWLQLARGLANHGIETRSAEYSDGAKNQLFVAYEHTVTAFAPLLKENLHLPEIHRQKIEFASQHGMLDLAFMELEESLKQHPDSIILAAQKIDLLSLRQQWDQASQYLDTLPETMRNHDDIARAAHRLENRFKPGKRHFSALLPSVHSILFNDASI